MCNCRSLDRKIRVIDESGDGYLYPGERFAEAELPTEMMARLLVRSVVVGRGARQFRPAVTRDLE
jgi:hypothetical protein